MPILNLTNKVTNLPLSIDTDVCPIATSDVKNIYIKISGGVVTEGVTPGAFLATKLTACGITYYVEEDAGAVRDLLFEVCPCAPTALGSSCDNPMKVEICGATLPPMEIELGGYDACYNGTPAHIEIIRNEDGTFVKYVAHLADGSGTIVDNAVASNISRCPETPELDVVYTNWLPICVDGVNWFVAERSQVNNVTAFDTPVKVYKQGANGIITLIAPTGTITDGYCLEKEVDCIESQYWSYGIDNTGTIFDWPSATYEMILSDGTTLTWNQTTASNAGWTAQLTEWAANIQTAANNAGLSWTVSPRYVNNLNPSDLSGSGSGLPGLPSVTIANHMVANGINARFVYIEICPGNPVPVKAVVKAHANSPTANGVYDNNGRVGYTLIATPALLSPVTKFYVCRSCGNAPVWYLSDGITLALPGQIPTCYQPCGTYALVPPPPERECQTFISDGCDNLNQSVSANFVQGIQRHTTICGDKISVNYFQTDPLDVTALIDYTLVGQFVDCTSGEVVPDPQPVCSKFEITKLYRLAGVTPGIIESEYLTGVTTGPQGDSTQAAFVIDNFSPTGAGVTLVTAPTTIAGTLGLNDLTSTSGIQDIEIHEGWIVVTQPFDLRWTAPTEGAMRFELGLCGGDLVEQFTYAKVAASTIPTPVTSIPKGIHKIKLTNLDLGGSNSDWNAQISTNGGLTWTNANIPSGVTFSTTLPYEICETIKVCEDTGVATNLVTGAVVSLSSYYTCPLACEPIVVEPTYDVTYPACDGTNAIQTVNQVVGAYVLNQENKHTERIYDVLRAVFGGTISYAFSAPLKVTLSYSGVTIANDTIRYYWTDFGDGYNDVGSNPSHTYNADGSYEVKSYGVTLSGNKILLTAKEVNISNGVITYAPPSLPQPVTASYNVLVSSAFQDYCGSLLVGSPYNADGTAYTVIGDLETDRPIIIDELEDNADYQAAIVSTPTQRIHENFVITGTAPLVIPAGAISISVTKTNNTGIVNISGDNSINFPLTFNRENFADSVNEEVSTLSAYTITGTAAGTTYKVHIIR